MNVSGRTQSWLESVAPEAIPDVDDVRPTRCPCCGTPSRRGRRVVLQGHGRRTRLVVVTAAVGDEDDGVQVVECWQRRYRCKACHGVSVILPKGVLPRFLYCVAAIVFGFFLVEDPPVGEGLSQAEAYDRQGMLRDVTSRAFRDPGYRWRSLQRWAARARQWWTDWTGETLSGLLLLFVERAGGQSRAAAVEVAVDSHVRWGLTM